jgi:hypothetical protein
VEKARRSSGPVPAKFELVLNLKAAKPIGLEVPYSVLVMANKLIE